MPALHHPALALKFLKRQNADKLTSVTVITTTAHSLIDEISRLNMQLPAVMERGFMRIAIYNRPIPGKM